MGAKMIRYACSILSVLLLWVFATTTVPDGNVLAQGDQHAYFNALVTRSDFYKGYSLRPKAGAPAGSVYDEKQLLGKHDGGLHVGSCPPSVTYDAAMDAAKSPIKAFQQPGVCQGPSLTVPVPASTSGAHERVTLSAVTSTWGPPMQRQVLIENEVLEIRSCTIAEGGDGARGYIAANGTLCVIRGQYGTAASAHPAGIKPGVSTNQINNYLRIPVGTADGNTYLFTWDGYWTTSYLGLGKWDSGQKTFQFTDKSESKLFEPKLWFDTTISGFDPQKHVGAVAARSYNSLNTGQNTWAETNGNTLGPGIPSHEDVKRVGNFIIKPNTWTRWWVRIEQRANDWDYLDMWIADEATNPVQILSQIPISVGRSLDPAKQSVGFFWFELGNSSTGWKRGDLRDLTAYFRNWVVLRNPPAVHTLLLRPIPGSSPPPPESFLVSPPTNLKIIG